VVGARRRGPETAFDVEALEPVAPRHSLTSRPIFEEEEQW
jgi:hypothetical protein